MFVIITNVKRMRFRVLRCVFKCRVTKQLRFAKDIPSGIEGPMSWETPVLSKLDYQSPKF